MNTKNILTDNIGQIDGKLLDEYYDRRAKRLTKRKNIMKYCGVAAAVMLITATSIAFIPMLRNSGNNDDPIDNGLSVQTPVTEKSYQTTGEQTSAVTKPENENAVVYAPNDTLGLIAEDVYFPPYGEIYYRGFGEFSDDDETLYAVRLAGMNYDMFDFQSDEHWQQLRDREAYCSEQEKDHLDEFHIAPDGTWDYADAENCDECARLRKQHTEAFEKIAQYELEYHIEKHLELHKMIADHAENLGYKTKTVILIPEDMPEDAQKLNTIHAIILYMTKQQMLDFTPSKDLALVFEPIPKWMDTGEDVIYYDADLLFVSE